MKLLSTSFVLFLTLSALASRAPALTITFDEISPTPADGLSILGVDFSFEIGGSSSPDAVYGNPGPGSITYVQGESLEGNTAGLLTMSFDQPTSVLEFGVAFNTFQSLSPGFSVELFDPALSSLGVTDVDTDPLISFTEGQFAQSGPLVSQVVVSFDSAGASRFALDNLTVEFQSLPQPEPMPEPTAPVAFAAGFVVVTLATRNHRRRAAARRAR